MKDVEKMHVTLENEHNKKIKHLQKELDALKSKADILEKENKEIPKLSKKLKDAETLHGKSNTEHSKSIKELQKNFIDLKSKADKLEKENKDIPVLQAEIKGSKKEFDKLQKKRNEEQKKYGENLSGASKRLQKEKEKLGGTIIECGIREQEVEELE